MPSYRITLLRSEIIYCFQISATSTQAIPESTVKANYSLRDGLIVQEGLYGHGFDHRIPTQGQHLARLEPSLHEQQKLLQQLAVLRQLKVSCTSFTSFQKHLCSVGFRFMGYSKYI